MFSTDEKRLLRDSWKLVLPVIDTAADLFYRRLFELQPGYRGMFPDDMSGQKRKLMGMLGFAVKASDWPDDSWAQDVAHDNDLVLVVLALGRRHAMLYKVPKEAYATVGEALIWSLDMGLGQAFTAETRAVWKKLYSVMSSTMLMGASQAAKEGAR
jgi:hemoglobin-like flavoprotein